MMTTEQMRDWIDKATYEQLLSKWRFAPVGSPWFSGEIGKYYQDRMAKLRNVDPVEHVRASKSIGW